MDVLEEELNRTLDYLQRYLTLANSHTVDFIVNNAWEQVIPNDIRIESDYRGAEHILDTFYNTRSSSNSIRSFIENAAKYEIKFSRLFKRLEELNFPKVDKNPKVKVKITEFMSSKKIHEVESMSQFVANVSSVSNTSLIIDIGSGKGYLTSVLALQHNFKILGIDCSQTKTIGAAKTTMKLEKKWKVYERKAQNLPKTKLASDQPIKEACSSHKEYYNKYKWKSAVVGDLYKQRVQCVSKNTNMTDILHEEYPEEDHQNVLIVGLHTCGDLAASCLELFATNRNRIKSIISVGCCYHLLEEKFASNPDWLRRNSSSGDFAFPMSKYLTNKGVALGRDARMCGTQKPVDFNDHEVTSATKPLFYRALLQKLMKDKSPSDRFPQAMTGRIAHKCSTFQEYVSKASKKLEINLQINDEDFNLFVKTNSSHWDRLKIFFILKSALSPVIESVILLDRLLYLYEKDVTNAFVVRLFDPVISPRCNAIVALPSDTAII